MNGEGEKDLRQMFAALRERLGGLRWPLLVVLAGLLLLALPTGSAGQRRTEPTSQDSAAEVCDLTALEERLAESLSRVEGVGRAEVVLTLSALSRDVLAESERRRGEEWERAPVVVQDADRSERAVVTQVLAPCFQGALVVCDGGGSAAVRLEVTRAVSALTGLGADRITVCARTGGRQ